MSSAQPILDFKAGIYSEFVFFLREKNLFLDFHSLKAVI